MTFRHSEPFCVGEREYTAAQIIEILGPQITKRRRGRIDSVIAGRCYSLVPVLDGIYDRGNVSAVMRTAEALGFGELHVIESQEGFKAANRVTQGADKWLDIEKWSAPDGCIDMLKRDGLQIVATELEASVPLDEVDFTLPTAVVFGNERDGVCEEVLRAADARVVVPMSGFAQSFNISVAAALTLYHAMHEREAAGSFADLDAEQRDLLRASYYLRSVENHQAILERCG